MSCFQISLNTLGHSTNVLSVFISRSVYTTLFETFTETLTTKQTHLPLFTGKLDPRAARACINYANRINSSRVSCALTLHLFSFQWSRKRTLPTWWTKASWSATPPSSNATFRVSSAITCKLCLGRVMAPRKSSLVVLRTVGFSLRLVGILSFLTKSFLAARTGRINRFVQVVNSRLESIEGFPAEFRWAWEVLHFWWGETM